MDNKENSIDKSNCINLEKQCTKSLELLPDLEVNFANLETKSKEPLGCPVAWALHVIKTARENACGKSVMCRDGLWQLEQIMEDGISGKGQSEDLELMADILDGFRITGCDLVKQTAILVKASISEYTDEWEAHIKRKKCAYLVCKEYYTVHIDPSSCQGSGDCKAVCPEGAIIGKEGCISIVDQEKCTKCGKCFAVCGNNAIIKAGSKKPKVPEELIPVGSFEEGGSGGRRRRRRG